MLSSHSRKQPGFPFGSLMPYALDKDGRPVFLISTMAMHTQNLQADPRASLFLTEPDPRGDPLGAARVTLIGNVLRIPESDLAEARSVYLASYPDSKHWVDFDDFFFYRMDVVDIYFVGGFGVMGWVAALHYSRAHPDPLIDYKVDIMHHLNANHKDELILVAKRLADVAAQDAEMISVDRLGFHLRLKTQDGVRGARIAFCEKLLIRWRPGKSSSRWFGWPGGAKSSLMSPQLSVPGVKYGRRCQTRFESRISDRQP